MVDPHAKRSTGGRRFTLLVMLLLACLALGYSFRLSLIKWTANTLLQGSGIYLHSLDGLTLSGSIQGEQQLSLDRLEVTVASSQVTLQQLQLRLSIPRAELYTVAIDSASVSPLTLPAGEPADSAAVEILPLLDQLADIPLQSLDIDRLSHRAINHSVQLHWQRKGRQQQLLIDQQQQSLLLTLQWPERGGVEAELRLSHRLQAVMAMHVSLLPSGQVLALTATSQWQLAGLLAALDEHQLLPATRPTVAGQLEFAWQGQLPAMLPASIESWRGQISRLRLEARIKPTPDQPAYTLRGELAAPWQWQISGQPSWQVDMQAASVQLQLGTDNGRQQLQAELSQLVCHWQIQIDCQSHMAVALSADRMKWAGAEFSAIAARWQGELATDGQQLSATVAAGGQLSAALQHHAVKAAGLQLRLEQPLSLQYEFASGAVELGGERLAVIAPAVAFTGADGQNLGLSGRVNLDAIELRFQDQLQGSVSVNTPGLKVTVAELWVPPLALQSQLTLTPDAVALKGLFSSDRNKPLVALTANYRLAENRGVAHFAAEGLQFGTATPLSARFNHWPFNADLQKGRVAASAALHWHMADSGLTLAGKAELQLEKLAGFYQDIGFVGLDTTHALQWQAEGGVVSMAPAPFELELLEIGLPVSSLSGVVAVDSKRQQLRVAEFQASLLGGVVSTEDFTYHASTNSLLLLNVADVQLEKIVALAEYQAIEANGRISGQLPVEFLAEGISIDLGRLQAAPPGGIIRYQAASTGTNPAMKLVAEALQNYHYDTLESDVNYHKNGDLQLAIKLRGQNPTMNKGQKINVNLNVSDNIPSLLKSLQSSRVITDVLTRNIKQ